MLECPDGELDDRLEYRHRLIRLVRGFRPDLILTHRSTDYHPDHRFTGLLVQDAAYLLTVPAICPDVPHLAASPVILYFSDAFKKPCPFEPHVVVDIDDAFDRLVGMLHCHESQFYEWLPYNAGYLDQVPKDDAARRSWLADRMARRIGPLADRYRDLVIRTYGEEHGEEGPVHRGVRGLRIRSTARCRRQGPTVSFPARRARPELALRAEGVGGYPGRRVTWIRFADRSAGSCKETARSSRMMREPAAAAPDRTAGEAADIPSGRGSPAVVCAALTHAGGPRATARAVDGRLDECRVLDGVPCLIDTRKVGSTRRRQLARLVVTAQAAEGHHHRDRGLHFRPP